MLTNNEMRDYQRTLDGIYTGATLKGEMTLGKWCDRTRLTLQAVGVLKDDLQRKYDSDKGRFSNSENSKRWQEMQNEKIAFEDAARARIQRDLDSVLDAKRATFSKAMSAPDEASLRLLQTLRMRKNISAAEIASTVEHLNGNLQALCVLSEIAKDNGVVFPRLNTDFVATERETRAAVDRIIADSFKDDQTYNARLFLSKTGNNGPLRPFVDALDSPAYLDVSKIRGMPSNEQAV